MTCILCHTDLTAAQVVNTVARNGYPQTSVVCPRCGLVCDVTDKLNAVRGVQSGTRLTPLPNDGWRATNARPFEPTVPTADAETFAEIVKAQDEAIARLILGPLDESAKREALDALRALSADHVAATPPRRHNAHCPRCYGPAYQGLGAVKCEREGGCLATREPRVSPLDHDDGSYDITHSSIVVKHGPAGEFDCEPGYFTADDGPYATRDLAVAAWRETVLARAKREAGL